MRGNLRNAFAPAAVGVLAVCPHCWEVNPRAVRLCGRCGADMHLALQESGGLRATAPVQSPVPVGVRERLSPLQRMVILTLTLLLVAAHVLLAWSMIACVLRPTTPAPPPTRGASAAPLHAHPAPTVPAIVD